MSLLELAVGKRKRAIVQAVAGLSADETAVFITDDLDFSIFVKLQQLYEYFPPIRHQALHPFSGHWDHYLVERLRILIDKWSPTRITSPGIALELFVQKAKSNQ